jgi:hypothetical protein
VLTTEAFFKSEIEHVVLVLEDECYKSVIDRIAGLPNKTLHMLTCGAWGPAPAAYRCRTTELSFDRQQAEVLSLSTSPLVFERASDVTDESNESPPKKKQRRA